MPSRLFSSLHTNSVPLIVGQSITVASIGLFAGIALSYNAIIMPALRRASTQEALPIWADSYKIGKNIQVGLILTSLVAGSGVYSKTKNPYFLAAPLIMTSIIPYTFAIIMPINHALLDILSGKKSDAPVEQLFTRWDLTHFGRTVFSTVALFAIAYGALEAHRIVL